MIARARYPGCDRARDRKMLCTRHTHTQLHMPHTRPQICQHKYLLIYPLLESLSMRCAQYHFVSVFRNMLCAPALFARFVNAMFNATVPYRFGGLPRITKPFRGTAAPAAMAESSFTDVVLLQAFFCFVCAMLSSFFFVISPNCDGPRTLLWIAVWLKLGRN